MPEAGQDVASAQQTVDATLASAALSVERIDNGVALSALEHDWRSVYARDADAQLFLSWDWMTRVFAVNEGQWCVLVVRAENVAVAFLPLRGKTYWSHTRDRLCTELRLAGTLDWADYTGLLCDPAYEAAAIALLGARLRDMGWRRLVLKNLRIAPHRLRHLLAQFPASDYRVRSHTRQSKTDGTDLLVCPGVALGTDFDDFLGSRVSAKSRQKIRRYLRKVEGSDDYRFSVSGPETRDRDLDIFAALWADKWAPRKGAETQRLARSYRAIVARGLAAGNMFMPMLWQRDTPLGVLCSFIDADKGDVLFFATGRDERHTQLPVGLLLHAFSIRWAIANGLRYYDFLRGNEAYKYTFGAVDRPIQYLTITPRSKVTATRGVLDQAALDDVLHASGRYLADGRHRRAAIGYLQALELAPGNRQAGDALKRLAT